MRDALSEAVRASVCPCFGNRALMDEDAKAIATAVVRAALTGEVQGRYRMSGNEQDGFDLSLKGSPFVSWVMAGVGTEAQARAIQNALNLLADLEGA